MKRNKLSTLFEIIYPLLLLLLLYAIRKSFDKHEYGFQEHELSEEYYRFNRTQLAGIDYSLTDQGDIYTKTFNVSGENKKLIDIDISTIKKLFQLKNKKRDETEEKDYKQLEKQYEELINF